MLLFTIIIKITGLYYWSNNITTGLLCLIISFLLDVLILKKQNLFIKRSFANAILLNIYCIIFFFFLHVVSNFIILHSKDNLPIIAKLLCFALNILKIPFAELNGTLFLTTMSGALEFPITYDSLGLTPFITFLGIFFCYISFSNSKKNQLIIKFAYLSSVLFAVMLLRICFNICLFLFLLNFIGYNSEELPIGPLLNPYFIFLMYIPFILLFWRFIQNHCLKMDIYPTQEYSIIEFKLLKQTFIISGLILAVLFLFLLWRPHGIQKNGRLIINTYHTQWSRTDREYDKNWFGSPSGYNYNCLKRFYELFYDVEENNKRITDETLKDASVLLIYDPNQAFTQNEKECIHRFVKDGGGLFLLGDHTNVFGSTANLNGLCQEYGFIFRDDILFDMQEDFFQITFPKNTSTFVNGLDLFKFKGSCSIKPTSIFTSTIFAIPNSKSFRAIYSVNNFYPPPRDNPRMKTGLFATSVSSRFGKGRVVAFGDSTVFSNFEIFYPGKYEFLLNVANWLNHQDTFNLIYLKYFSLLAIVLLVVYMLMKIHSPRIIVFFLTASISVFYLCSIAAESLNARNWSFPKLKEKSKFVFFFTDPDRDEFGLKIFYSKADYAKKHDLFIQWVLRNKMFPAFYMIDQKSKNALYHFLTNSEQVDTANTFILKNRKHFENMKSINPAIFKQKKRFLFLLGSKVDDIMMKDILQFLGLSNEQNLNALINHKKQDNVILNNNGKTYIFVLNGTKFSDRYMGFSEKVRPNETQKKLYEQEYKLLDKLFKQ